LIETTDISGDGGIAMAVTGIGGFFFRARDPAALSEWYRTHLGIGGVPELWHQAAGPTVFEPFALDTDYFAAEKSWMLNLRVDDLNEMIASFQAAGVEVITKAEWDSGGIGRFARIHDPEGNAIELWEPPAD
jgi:catechol 2,3-dioxygenase-like lactoylglutathione lyase family enzyme